MATTVKIWEKYQVTIPETVRNQIPLTVGERVEVSAQEGKIVIRPIMEIPRGEAWFWSPKWQEQVAQSKQDVKRGKVKVFRSVKEARKALGD